MLCKAKVAVYSGNSQTECNHHVEFLNTGVDKSRFTVFRIEKDMQVMIITVAKIDKS
jgi:hypothetical protein